MPSVRNEARAFVPAVGLPEASRGADEHKRGDALGVVDGQPRTDGSAERDPGVRKAVDTEPVHESEDETGDVADSGDGGQ